MPVKRSPTGWSTRSPPVLGRSQVAIVFVAIWGLHGPFEYRYHTASMRSAFALAALLLLVGSEAAAQAPSSKEPPPGAPQEVIQLPPVEVIGTTPLPSLGVPLEKYPGNAQRVPAEEIRRQNLTNLPEQLFRNFGSVNTIGSQGNPWQVDLTYRGFLGGPLTGSPIGLSVYLDGMRFNDGFGDTINWDLIPQFALSAVDMIPGSNPLFGLNTLGGALSMRTKRGFDFPGFELGASGGSWGRWNVESSYGGSHGPFDWFLGFNGLSESGWRDQSPTDLRQLFAKAGYRTAQTDVELSYIYANNQLVGNGLVPESTLAIDRSAVYTFPDQTKNVMHLANLRGSQWLTDAVLLSGNVFYRNYRRDTFNGDAEVNCVDDATDSRVFTANGRPLHLGLCQGSAVGFFDEQGNPLAGNLGLEAEGADRKTSTRTQDWGATLQFQHRGTIFGRANRLTLGVAYDGHATRFTQSEAPSDFAARGNSVGTVRTGAFETDVDVKTEQQNIGAYVADTLEILPRLGLTLAARFQRVSISIRDRSGENAALDGDHDFNRVSPAVGITYQPIPALTTFFSYSEGFRAPTPAELTCADPAAPCRLPNAFVADPPLDPVTARTYEVGVRGKLPLGDALSWSLALFRTDLSNDILFITAETGGAGFFQNVAGTRRQGIEAGVQGRWKRLSYFLSYAYVDSTYRSSETLSSVTDPNGVQVRKGDHIPGIPDHNLKVGGEVEVWDDLFLGANVLHVSGSYLRGDDGNDRPKLDGYTTLGLGIRYSPIKHVELWGRVDNVTNAHYETAGAVNFNAFADPIAPERFVAPGAPIAGWGGIRIRF
jgi:iron complex outermembrane receptor protein